MTYTVETTTGIHHVSKKLSKIVLRHGVDAADSQLVVEKLSS